MLQKPNLHRFTVSKVWTKRIIRGTFMLPMAVAAVSLLVVMGAIWVILPTVKPQTGQEQSIASGQFEPVVYHSMQTQPIPQEVESTVTQMPISSVRAIPEGWFWPLHGTVSIGFGWEQHSIYKDWRFHRGIDISAPEGQVVNSVSSGQVKDIRHKSDGSYQVIVSYGQYEILYDSLFSPAVQEGADVSGGAVIGTVGKSNEEPYSHVHIEINKDGEFVDPLNLLP